LPCSYTEFRLTRIDLGAALIRRGLLDETGELFVLNRLRQKLLVGNPRIMDGWLFQRLTHQKQRRTVLIDKVMLVHQ
jgi:hypothetical protein